MAYPQAIAQMPGAPLFSVLFFLMVLCLGIDSQFAMVETVLTALADVGVLPSLSKPMRAALVCVLMGLIGLLFVTRAGMHWLELFDTFASNLVLFACGALECIAVGWVYGADRFAADTASMTGQTLPAALLWMYRYFVPAVLFLLVLVMLILSLSSAYAFPPAGIAVGWLLTSLASAPLLYFGLRHCGRQTPKAVLCAFLGGRGAPSTAVIRRGPQVQQVNEVRLGSLVTALATAPAAAGDAGGASPVQPAPSGMVAGPTGSPHAICIDAGRV